MEVSTLYHVSSLGNNRIKLTHNDETKKTAHDSNSYMLIYQPSCRVGSPAARKRLYYEPMLTIVTCI